MASSVNVPKTYGALLLGGLFAAVLTGVVSVQVIVYCKLYTEDSLRIKYLVLAVWLLDICHTSCIWSALWDYLIETYGIIEGIDTIWWNVALTVVFTAILTFLVHCFFAHRIFLLSKRNKVLVIPIVVLAVLRLVSATATTVEMIRLGSFALFKAQYRWLFTLGLALSSGVDILITGSLMFLLQTSRTGAPGLNQLIDNLILYAFETGFLTCAGTIVSMICWLVMRHNLIFMGLHFVIGKFYANSLLVALNSRRQLRRSRSSHGPVLYLDTRRRHDMNFDDMPSPRISGSSIQSPKAAKLEISVERSIQYDDQMVSGRGLR